MGQLVSFRIDGLPLALPLEQVQEVVGMPAITPFGSSAWLRFPSRPTSIS